MSQCVWEDGATSQIESIVSSSYAAASSPPSSPTSNAATSSKKLAPGAIAGIVIGAVVVIGVVSGLIYYFFIRRRKHFNVSNVELPTNSEAIPKESYYGQELPSHVMESGIKPWDDPAQGHKILQSPDQNSYEVQSAEVFQLPGHHERSISETTNTIQYQGISGLARQDFPLELEGSRPEAREMDDTSSRGRLSPVSRTQSPPSTGTLSPASSRRYGTVSVPGSPLASLRR